MALPPQRRYGRLSLSMMLLALVGAAAVIAVIRAVHWGSVERVALPPVVTLPAPRPTPRSEITQQSTTTAATVAPPHTLQVTPRRLEWTARGLYLPATEEAIAGFKRYEDRQRDRDPSLLQSWRSFSTSLCLQQVPECEFFQAIKLELLFVKCCAEHTKLQSAFNFTMDVADASHLPIFLDSGTLLSAMRDGEMTLVPWETDIDLGIVGVDPALLAEPFSRFVQDLKARGSRRRRHYFEPCLTKVSKNVSRNGRCKDAHHVYYAATAEEALHDSSRVEIWPFWPEPGVLVHPTRKKLSISPEFVEPLVPCRFWGRSCWCPKDSIGYLNHEYGQDGSWRYPKTIHWGKENVGVVKKRG